MYCLKLLGKVRGIPKFSCKILPLAPLQFVGVYPLHMHVTIRQYIHRIICWQLLFGSACLGLSQVLIKNSAQTVCAPDSMQNKFQVLTKD